MQENILGLEGKGRQQCRAILHHADSKKGGMALLGGRVCLIFMPPTLIPHSLG